MQPAGARCPRAIFACLALLAMLPSSAGAQESPLRELSFEELGALTVTSMTKHPEDLWGVPAAMWVITAAEIRRSGATSIPEVLRLAPGVEVARVDSSHWSIGIRGLGDQFSKSLLVLIDGRNIYSPLFAGTYWPAYDVALEDVQRIEVIRGPAGATWGGNAVNGVINIITRSAGETRGTMVAVGAGSVDQATAYVRHGGGTERFSYRVYGRGFLRGPQHHPDGVDFDDDWWLGQAGVRLDWDRGAAGTFTLQGDVNDGRHGQRVEVSTIVPARRFVLDGLAGTAGGHVLARMERRAGRSSIRAQVYYDRLVWEAPHFAETRDTIDVDYVQTLPPFARQRLTVGGGSRWSPGRFSPVLPTVTFTPGYEVDWVHNVFVQDEVAVVPGRLALTLGTKLEYNKYTDVEVLPTARLAWTPHAAQTFWAAATRAVRTPSRIERSISLKSLTSAAGPVFLEIAGSDQFDSEEAVGYEVGYRALIGAGLTVFAAAFHTEHDDLAGFGRPTVVIEPSPLHGNLRFPHVNGVKGQSHGFEVTPEWRPLSWWHLSGWYAWRRFDLHSKPANIDPAAVARHEGAAPQNQGRVTARFTLPLGWEVDAAYRHVGDLRIGHVASYRTGDLRVGRRLSDSIELSIAGQNLFEPHHRESAYRPGPSVGIARSVYAKLTWTVPER